MKRLGLFLLAVLMVTGIAGCDGDFWGEEWSGSGDSSFDGRWLFTYSDGTTQQYYISTNAAEITVYKTQGQETSSLTLWAGRYEESGVDTFYAESDRDNNAGRIEGAMVDNDHMQGIHTRTRSGKEISRLTWTAARL